jgi:RNA polymerase sigma-70 factor (ECF subfamily)
MTNREFNSSLIEMRPKLHMFAMSLTSDREKAPDLVQDTYLKALTSKDKFVDFTNFKAWVFTIMKNTFINNYRRNVKRNFIIDSTLDLYNVDRPCDSGFFSPESDFAEEELETSIESLGEEFRIPFRMHIDGYKYKEIADTLGLKLGTVKSRIYLSRQKLMPKLKDYKR